MCEKCLVPKLRFENFDEEWESSTLGKISRIGKGFTPSTMNPDYWNGVIDWLSISDMNQGKYINTTAKKITLKGTKNKKIIKKGTLLMSFKLSIGKLGILNKDMYTNEAICNFQWKNKDILTEYMYYYLNSINIMKYGSQAAKGITLNNDSLTTIPVLLPSLKEQEKIANFLSSVDKKTDLLKQKLNQTKYFKKYLLENIFSQKLRFKGFNDNWKELKLKEIGEINIGNTPSTKIKEYYTDKGYLWVTPSDINNSKYVFNTEKQLSEEGAEKGRFVAKNSVLVTCIASIGKNCIIQENGYFNQQINSITPKKQFNADFIYYLICHNEERMKKLAGITATPILNKKSFENIFFKFPSIDEQELIADILSTTDRKIELLNNQIVQMEKFKKGLLQQMFI